MYHSPISQVCNKFPGNTICKINIGNFLSLNLLKVVRIKVRSKDKGIGINSQCLVDVLKSFIFRIVVAFVSCKVLSKGFVKIPS